MSNRTDNDNNGIFIGLALAALFSAFRRPEPPAPPVVVETRTVYRRDPDSTFFDVVGAIVIAIIIILGLWAAVSFIFHDDNENVPPIGISRTYGICDHPNNATEVRLCYGDRTWQEINLDAAPRYEYEEGRDIDFTAPWKLAERKVTEEGTEWSASVVTCIYKPPAGKRQTFRTESGVHNVPESYTVDDVTKCAPTIDKFYYEGGSYQS